MTRHAHSLLLFPYTTLFRSLVDEIERRPGIRFLLGYHFLDEQVGEGLGHEQGSVLITITVFDLDDIPSDRGDRCPRLDLLEEAFLLRRCRMIGQPPSALENLAHDAAPEDHLAGVSVAVCRF